MEGEWVNKSQHILFLLLVISASIICCGEEGTDNLRVDREEILASSDCSSVLWIYELGDQHESVDPQRKYDAVWKFPDDYVVMKTYPRETPIIYNSSVVGGVKIYQCEKSGNAISINMGWGASITAEGSLIYHGPRCDVRGEVCIIVPFGYSLAGLEIGQELSVVEALTFKSGGWIRDTAYGNRQVYNITYQSKNNRGSKLLTQEVTWYTNNLSPVVKTTWRDDGIHAYDLKEYERLWHPSDCYKYAPHPEFDGMRRNSLQVDAAINNLDALIMKLAAETKKFDKYRNPDTLPY